MVTKDEKIEVEEHEIEIPIEEQMDELSGISPFARLVTNLYSDLKLIDPYERRSFALSVDKPAENKLVQKINSIIDAVTSSKVGSLVTLLIMKLFKRWYMQIDFVSDVEKAKYDMKKAMIDEIRDEMVEQ